MDFDISNVLTGVVSGAGSATVAGIFVKAWLSSFLTEVSDLRREVKSLRDEKIVGLAARLKQMEDSCVGKQQAEVLSNLIGWMKKNDLVLADIRDSVRRLEAAAEGDRRWLENLNNSHREHANDHSIHEVHHG